MTGRWRPGNPALVWSLAGSVLTLAGAVMMIVTLVAGLDHEAIAIYGSLISAGAICTVIGLLITRGVLPLSGGRKPDDQGPGRQAG